MGINLGPLNIKDSFGQLVQISGSQLTDGSGSLISSIDVNASTATSASFASQAGTSGFATTATSASYATTASFAISSSADDITLQQVTDNGNVTTLGVQLGGDSVITGSLKIGDGGTHYNAINIETFGGVNTITTDANSVGTIAIGAGNTTGKGTSISIGNNNTNAVFSNGANNVVIGRNNAIAAGNFTSANYILGDTSIITGDGSGRVVIGFDNDATAASFGGVLLGTANTSGHNRSVVVGGTGISTIKDDEVVVPNLRAIGEVAAATATFTSASIGYLSAVTGSITKIGDAFVLLNTSDVTRYAGLIVEDSGSATPINYTASFFFDSELNDWNYEYTSGSTDYGVALFGPTYSTKGSPIYLTANTLPKAEGHHHLIDSSISDDGTDVVISANVSASGFVSASTFYGDGSNLTGISGGGGAGFPFTGSAVITGSLEVLVSGSVDGYTITSGSLSGSLIDNLGQQSVGTSTAVKHVVYCTQAEYDGLTPDQNTLYMISGSWDVVNDLVVSGSMVGEVGSIAIASNTGSLDCSTGNYFTLTLQNGVDTRLEASNIQAGQTINVKITNNATAAGTISFGTMFEFEGGTAFTATAATSAVDIITMVSFDGTSLQVVGVKNFS